MSGWIDAHDQFERRHAPLIEALREGGHRVTVIVTTGVDPDGYVDYEPFLLCTACGEIREMWPWRLVRGLRPNRPCRGPAEVSA